MNIIIRKKFWPKAPADWLSFTFILAVIPLFYWFSIFVVLPKQYSDYSTWKTIHFIFGTFLMISITSNFVALVLADTSVHRCYQFQSNIAINYCEICQTASPVRSWHCTICNTCILKRDHHCTFAGCCIGHYNHRYFMMFLFYFFVGSCYTSYLNIQYVWQYVNFEFLGIVKVICPLVFYLLGIDSSLSHCLTILLILNIVGAIISGILFYFHMRLVLYGVLTHEKNRQKRLFNFGIRYNIMNVFGKKWYLCWISPFIASDLLHDGSDWELPFAVNTENFKYS